MPTRKKQTTGLIIGLVVQYLLGMYVNMFVPFPEQGSEAQMWEFAKSHPSVMAHILIGTILLLNALFFFIRALRSKDTIWKKTSGLGVLGIVIAFVAGEQFIGSQNDVLSYAMSLGFILALLSYFWELYKTK
jgi:heme A synthase